MKKLIGILLIAVFFVFPLCASADIIAQVNLTEKAVDPTQNVTFVNLPYSGGAYLDYKLSLNNGPWLEGFCVEGQYSPAPNTPYTLLSIQNPMGFGLDTNRYLAAAWVAQEWASGQVTKAAAQLAIWEIVVDGLVIPNLFGGNFYTVASGYTSEANTILGALPFTFPDSGAWLLAVNPQVFAGGTVLDSPQQNYIVQVPEPGILILLGIAMSAIGAASWRIRRI